ncbi:hypothetical protein B0H12DRAFT_1079476 [Mycena haematopus]|nr:hypothetical protein B0H12DRAFT_1079476 [Mycena haematopus]
MPERTRHDILIPSRHITCRLKSNRGQSAYRTHPALQVLHLQGIDSSILRFLTCPSLVELYYDDYDEDHNDFADFLSRSRPPLLRLSLHDGAYPRILYCFQFLMDLTALEISDLTVAGMSDFLHDLVVRDPASFLPNLESFASSVSFEGQDPHTEVERSGIHYGDLADALELRWNRTNSCPRLKSFRMTWRPAGLNVDPVILTPPPDFYNNFPRLQHLIEEVENGKAGMSRAWI